MEPIKDYILGDLKNIAGKLSEGLTAGLAEQGFYQDPAWINLFAVLYFHEMRLEPENPQNPRSDHLVVSHLGAVPYLLGTLACSGRLPWGQVSKQLLFIEKEARSHSLLLKLPGVSGVTSLPQMGADFANGLAINGKFSRLPYRVYHVFAPQDNPKLFEAAFSAARVPLDNLTYLVPGLDRENRILLIHRWFALGWNIQEVDFSDLDSLLAGLAAAGSNRNRPSIIIG